MVRSISNNNYKLKNAKDSIERTKLGNSNSKLGCRYSKGQILTFDFTVGVFVLAFIMLLYILLWNNIALRWNLVNEHTRMETSAFFAAESILATPGEPESWEMLSHIDGNVSAIGLANGRNELNRMKIEKLVAENATSYGTIKARLGLQRYELGISITDIYENEVYYEFGIFSTGSLSNSLNFNRFGILDGEPVIVHMEVWKDG